jgi:hypothetical protein
MKHFLLSLGILATIFGGAAALSTMTPVVQAATWDGPGLVGGVQPAASINGPIQNTSIRQVVVDLLRKVLNFLALAATVVIIIAGIWLIVGQGSDDSKTKAKNIVLYTIIGLLIVFFARAIVGFFTGEFWR